jgi:NDP-sugar pyrophosphorylase family protein
MLTSDRPPIVTAAILAGGRGTRLRPVLKQSPKVLAPVANRPFITFLLDRLAAAGIHKVIMLTGYMAAQVRRALGDGYAGMRLTYSVETSPLGTAGALRRALPHLDGDAILLLNGDSFCAVNLARLASEHFRRSTALTMTVVHVPDASRFGQVKIAPTGAVVHFGEKEPKGGPGWINAGIHVLAKSLVAEIPPRQFCSLERDFLPSWVDAGRVWAFKERSQFLDIGTPSSYAGAAAFFGVDEASTRLPRSQRRRRADAVVGSGLNDDRVVIAP